MSDQHPQSENMKALEQSLNDHMQICKLQRKVKNLTTKNTRLKAELVDLKSEAGRFKAEVERLRKAGEWKPIETAPKDGTEVMLCFLSPYITDSGETAYEYRVIISEWTGNQWLQINYDEGWCREIATYWMPIQNPPSAEDGKPTE
jgi:regulator of replication initiation timing